MKVLPPRRSGSCAPACVPSPHCVSGLYGQSAPLRPWVVRPDYIPSPLRGFVWLGDCCAGVAPCRAPPPACGLPPHCVPGLYGQPAPLRPWVVRSDYIPSPLRGFVWLGDCCTGVPPCRALPPVCGLSPHCGPGLYGLITFRRPFGASFGWAIVAQGLRPVGLHHLPVVCRSFGAHRGRLLSSARNGTCSSLGTTIALR